MSGGKPLFLTCFYLSIQVSIRRFAQLRIEQVRKRGLPPLVEKVTSNTLIPH